MKYLIRSLPALFILTINALAQSVLDDCPDRTRVGGLNDCCGNFGDDLPIDTLQGPYPYMIFETYIGSLSPDGRYLACNIRQYKPYLDGAYIIDIHTNRIIDYHPGARLWKWSPDGKRVVTTRYIFDFADNVIIPFPKFPDGTSFLVPQWSVDGRHIYYNSNFGSFRSTSDGDSLYFIGSKYGSIPYSLDTLLCIERYQRNLSTPGYELYHIPSGTYSFFPCAEWDSVDTFWQQGVSHDGRFVALDVTYKGGYRFNSMHSLSIFDRWTRRMKKVLPAQAFMNWYYPSWTRRGTLIVSFACRLDSSYTIWEIDTNGVFLRQLTGRDMQQQTADVELPSHLTEFSIHSLHPQPGTGTITVEYDVRRAGVYSLKLIDLRGRQARSIRDVLWHEAGRYIASLRTDALAPGMYLLRLSDRNDRAVYQKVLIDR